MLLIIEIFAVIFNLICVWLITQNNIWNWPIGIIGVILLGISFFIMNLPGQILLQIVFLIQSLYGWYNWSAIKNKVPAPIKYLTKHQYISQTILLFIVISVLYFPLSLYTLAGIELLDSITLIISLIATWLLAKRYIDNWYFWIFVDPLYIILFILKGAIIYSVLYGVFFFMAIYGLMNWKKEYRLQK